MAKKLYVVHTDAILWGTERTFDELSDKEVADIIKKDKENGGFHTQSFDSMEEVAHAWNTDNLFSVDFSYMRVMEEVK